MKEYRRSFFSLIKGIIIAPFGGLVAAIILHFFLSAFISYITGGAITAILLYMAIFSENIRFELDGDGTFRYFKKGALRNTFNLSEYRIGYYAKTESGVFGNNDIQLKLLNTEGEETDIEATSLGTSRFYSMFAEMEKYAIKNVETLTADNK
jgi:hypothetical protein